MMVALTWEVADLRNEVVRLQRLLGHKESTCTGREHSERAQ